MTKSTYQNETSQNQEQSFDLSQKFDLPQNIKSSIAFGYAKRKTNLTPTESNWLYKEFLIPVAKTLYSNARMPWNGKGNYYPILKNIEFDDLLGQVCVFFWEKDLTPYVNEEKGSFGNLFYTSVFRYIRDKSSKSTNGSGMSTRLRRSDSDKLKALKLSARMDHVRISSDSINENADQSAIELESMNFTSHLKKDLFSSSDIETKAGSDFWNSFVTEYPVLFSRVILSLSSDQIWISPNDRGSLGDVEINNLYQSGIVDESLISSKSLRAYISRWIKEEKTEAKGSSAINWFDVYADVDEKINTLMEIGVDKEIAKKYISWIQINFENYQKQ